MRCAIVPLLLILALFAPLAAAHAVPADFAIDPFSEPLSTEGETSTLIIFDYRCSGMSTNGSEEGMGARFLVSSAPAWVEARVEPEAVELPACEGIGRATATLVASAVEDAVAFDPGAIEVTARWATSGFELDSVARVEVVGAWRPAIVVDIPEPTRQEKAQTAAFFPVTFTNAGSGLTKLSFEVLSKGESLQAVVPNPVILQGRGHPQAIVSIPFAIQTPYRNGPMDEVGAVTYRMTPSMPLDPTQRGEPQEFTLTVHTEGFYVPAAAQFFGALAVLGLAAALRSAGRRR